MDIGNLGGGIADPFADLDLDEKPKKSKKKTKEADEDAELKEGGGKHVHIRVQQRNGRKCITTVQGLAEELDLKKILKAIKKAECCNGSTRPPLARAAAPREGTRPLRCAGRS